MQYEVGGTKEAALGSIIRRFTLMLPLLIGLPHPIQAQVAVGARVGSGGGSAGYMIGEVSGRVHLKQSVYVSAGYEMMGGGVWACAESPLEAIRCGYEGNTVAAGVGYAPIDTPSLHVGGRVLVGRFTRTGTYGGREYRGSKYPTASAGVDLELRVWGPIRIQGGILHRQVFDGLYRGATGQNPHFTAVSLGLTFAFLGAGMAG